jgi:hypothetical protein
MMLGSIVIGACCTEDEKLMDDPQKEEEEDTCKRCINSRDYDAITYITHCTIIFYHISII